MAALEASLAAAKKREVDQDRARPKTEKKAEA